MGSTRGAQRIRSILSAWLESSYSSEQMLPFMCTYSVWHPGRMLTSCCGLENKLNDLHKVLMISSLKAEVAKKPSEEACLILLLLIYSGGLVATRRRISALCYWLGICSWFKEIEVSSVQAIYLFPGPCIHASSDRAALESSGSASSLPWMFPVLMKDIFVLEAKHTQRHPGRFVCARFWLRYLVKQRNSLKTVPWSFSCLRRSAGVKWLKAPSVQQCAQHLFLVSALIFQSLPAWAASECVWEDLHGKAVV